MLTDRQWDRLLRASPGDSLELFLHLTAEQNKELLDRRRVFITCGPHLKRFSERIYEGLTRHAALEGGTRPEFHSIIRGLISCCGAEAVWQCVSAE